jgi:hypothetical protein
MMWRAVEDMPERDELLSKRRKRASVDMREGDTAPVVDLLGGAV